MKPGTEDIRLLTRTALLCAVLCVLSVLSLPIGPVPVTLGMLGVFLCGMQLPPKNACLAVLGYLLLGAVGLPVFSSMQGGIGILFGLTGGYLWGYLPTVCVLSAVRALLSRRPERAPLSAVCAGCAALAVCYLCGTAQFVLLTGSTWQSAAAVCVVPFLPFDLLKLAAAVMLSHRFRRRL